jgi:DNA-binding NtrC family response regulator
MADERDAAPTAPATRRGAVPRRRTLLVVRGDRVDAHPLPLDGVVTVGRGSDAGVQIDDPSISRVHLSLALAPHAITVTDKASANGTTLREVRLPPNVPVQIGANEAFAAGDVVLAIQDVGAPLAAAGDGAAAARPSGTVAAGEAPIVLDPAMKKLYDLAARVARGTISVLLRGETGTGKEVLCEHLHRASARARGPLIRINCGALGESMIEAELFGHERGAFTGAHADREGLLEAADGGTVFLDEIGELPAGLQAKLLRVVEDRAVTRIGSTTPRTIDVRFVAATNRDLEAEVDAGRFRRDLYFRLAGVILEIPPLAERPDEIVALARRFAAGAAQRLDRPAPPFADDAIAALRAHAWPGNVRELRNAIERAVLLVGDGDAIDAAALQLATPAAPAAAPAGDLQHELAAIEKQRIVEALARCDGNQTKAAELLGMPRRTLVKRLAEYGIPRPRK